MKITAKVIKIDRTNKNEVDLFKISIICVFSV